MSIFCGGSILDDVLLSSWFFSVLFKFFTTSMCYFYKDNRAIL